MATATPLLMRVGMHEVGNDKCRDPDITAEECLPCVVEVKSGTVVYGGTRLTEVKRETTDDN